MMDQSIDEIAKELSRHYRYLKDHVVMEELDEKGSLFALYRYYKLLLMTEIEKEEFAAIYSQTVIFVLFIAALSVKNELYMNDLKGTLIYFTYKLIHDDGIVFFIMKSITSLDIPKKLNRFILESREKLTAPGEFVFNEYNVLDMLYERFLKQYEPAVHKKIRYYYTPDAVVSFMVHTVHHLLKDELNIEEGLANTDIKILDPAFGAGNFPLEVIRLAIKEKLRKTVKRISMNVNASFSSCIHGFEIMLPLYVIGHLKLLLTVNNFALNYIKYKVKPNFNWTKRVDLISSKLSSPPLTETGNLYLTDTLTIQDRSGFGHALKNIGVIFCNPPYSRHSKNKGAWISRLVSDYMKVKNKPLEEKNLKGLQDDYVKFIRYSQWLIDENGSGIMAFITNSSYLENPTFRGMRDSLLKSFNEIYILDLHGTGGKVKKKDEDDENIFNISQGIAIGFFIKRKKTVPVKENFEDLQCKVYYYHIKGSKADKLKILHDLTESSYNELCWERVFPEEDFYLFTPVEKVDIYRDFIKVTDIFTVHGVGIVTARDKLTIKESEQAVYNIISFFPDREAEEARKIYRLGEDTRDWQVTAAQKDIKESFMDRSKIVPILYRPFDIRYTYYTGKSRGFLCMPRPGVMRHMLGDNIGLVTVRQVPGGVFSHCFITDTIIESRLSTSQKGIAYIFPLYKYIFPDDSKKTKSFDYNKVYPVPGHTRQCNIDPSVFTLLRGIFGKDNLPSAEQIFYYIYAVLHSGIYRERYRDHLKIDFPRVPFTSDMELFKELARLGEGLAGVHLLKSSELDQTFSKFEVIGNNIVNDLLSKPAALRDGRVYINESQYFSNITRELWEFEICGYQVLNRWLKARKNRALSTVDILHFIKICRAVQLTIKYSEEIDDVYAQLEKRL